MSKRRKRLPAPSQEQRDAMTNTWEKFGPKLTQNPDGTRTMTQFVSVFGPLKEADAEYLKDRTFSAEEIQKMFRPKPKES